MVLRYANQWLVGYEPAEDAQVRLICFPFAGGGVRVFRGWPSQFPSSLEILCVQLPGRGSRMNEAPITRWDRLLPELAGALQDFTDKPFAFLGHSLGGILAFEMARYFRRHGLPLPRSLFISACGAPHLMVPPARPIHLLSNEKILERVSRWGGVPPEILNYADAVEIFTKPLKGDLALVETYRYQDEAPLPVPIEAFGGRQDLQVSEDFLLEWKRHTLERFHLNMVPGGHFFLEENPEGLWRALNDWLGFCLAYNSF